MYVDAARGEREGDPAGPDGELQRGPLAREFGEEGDGRVEGFRVNIRAEDRS